MLDIKQLIKVAPISEQTKSKLLQDVGSYPPAKKGELVQTCWDLISMSYQEKIDYELEQLAEKSIEEERSLTSEEIAGVKEKYVKEFIDKLGGIENQEEINEVREKLTNELQKTLGTPNTT